MPELPEVETTLRGIAPYLESQFISHIILRRHSLRWPIPLLLPNILAGQQLLSIKRRAKYLLFETSLGTLIIHLGMSGTLQLVKKEFALKKHDHVDICLKNDTILRLNDPRRFGAVLWTEEDPNEHKLLSHLGPEPLLEAFTNDWLFMKSRNKKQAVKNFIMDNKVVVGIGNIYATEALFRAGIHPNKAAGKVSKQQYKCLTCEIKNVLHHAIACGGTTLKDFLGSDGKPGYFSIELSIYGRKDLPCTVCGNLIKTIKLAGRTSFYCSTCQQ